MGSNQIIASSTSSKADFDFLEGKWKVHNRRLNGGAWIEFEAELHMRKTLNGFGNIENYFTVIDGKPFEGQAVRLFNPDSKLWTVFWMDTNNLEIDKNPVIGSFENCVGRLYSNNKETTLLYQWDATNAKKPKWSQATSEDGGITWNWNWEMVLTKIK